MTRGRIACAAVGLALALGCTTPVELGERRYREGDRLGALEIWRQVDADSLYYDAARTRIAEVENEFDQLVVRYKKRARYYERRDRLAESVVNYRLALELQPGDREALLHVQELARRLDARKREEKERFDAAFQSGDLPLARGHLDTLRTLDPFDPRLQADDRRLDDSLRESVDALLVAGRTSFASGRHASAEKSFQSVLALDPENGDARGYLAYLATIRAEEKEGPADRPPTTLPASRREIRAEGHYRNALRAERDGRPFAAIRYSLRALRLNPEHGGARRHVAALRAQLSPEVSALIEDGRVHYEEEELESALDAWRRALLIDPGNEKAQEYVARAERLLQNLEQLRDDPAAQPVPRVAAPGAQGGR